MTEPVQVLWRDPRPYDPDPAPGGPVIHRHRPPKGPTQKEIDGAGGMDAYKQREYEAWAEAGGRERLLSALQEREEIIANSTPKVEHPGRVLAELREEVQALREELDELRKEKNQ